MHRCAVKFCGRIGEYFDGIKWLCRYHFTHLAHRPHALENAIQNGIINRAFTGSTSAANPSRDRRSRAKKK